MDTPQPKHITCEHLFPLHHGQPPENREHVIIDLRDTADYEAGHIADSHHIPRRELLNIEGLVAEKTKKVIVILGPNEQAEIQKINDELHDMGYQNTEFLAGGIDEWCKIADLEKEVLKDLSGDLTPEERGLVNPEHSSDIDLVDNDSDPLY